MRAAIAEAAPDAVEVFSYGIPGFRLAGQPLLWYAAWKNHVSLYPVGEKLRRAHARALEGRAFSKGTIRFALDDPPTPALVERLARARAAEIRKATRGA